MSVTVPVLVVMVKAPFAFADIRPICIPEFLRCDGTSARTMSPVRKPCVNCFCLAFVRGKPRLSIKHICRRPWLHALISSGTTPLKWRCSGVLAPMHAASSQCAFVSPRVVRLYFVRPPVPHSIGSPKTCNLRYNAQRVALTAAASLSDALA